MKKLSSVLLVLIISVISFGCSENDSTNNGVVSASKSKEWTIESIRTSLDKHSFSEDDKPYYQLLGAYNGLKTTVNGDYRLEIYTFKNQEALNTSAETLETTDNQILKDKNALFLLHTDDNIKLTELRGDLND